MASLRRREAGERKRLKRGAIAVPLIIFSIYQISWIKIKKVTFCKLKTSISTEEVCLQFKNISGILSSAFLRFCCEFRGLSNTPAL